jgi:hypothetical protein
MRDVDCWGLRVEGWATDVWISPVALVCSLDDGPWDWAGDGDFCGGGEERRGEEEKRWRWGGQMDVITTNFLQEKQTADRRWVSEGGRK